MQQFDEIISASQNILITSHHRPDADAIGSVVAMKNYLDQQNKKCEIWITGLATNQWDYVDVDKEVNWAEDIANVVNNFDTLIFLDGNNLGRFSRQAERIDLSKFKTICIDHHPNQPDKFDLDLSNNQAAANCQNLYELFFKSKPELLNNKSAMALLVGILGDTGTFRYIKPHNSVVLEIGKVLIDKLEVDLQTIELEMNGLSELEMKLLAQLLQNVHQVTLPGIAPLTYTFLNKAALDIPGVNENILKSAIHNFMYMFLRRIDNHKWGFVVSPRTKNEFSYNFRSTPGCPNVRLIAETLGGGGHVLAAGAEYKVEEDDDIDSEELCEQLLEQIEAVDLVNA